MGEAQPNYTVQLGLLVRVEISYQDENDQLAFVIVPDDQADFGAGFLGESTPLAKTILGEETGAQIPYFKGDAHSVRVLSIEPTDRTPSLETAERREKKMKEAVQQVERTNAVIFASSFSGKWGDYDPEGIEAWDKENLPNKSKSDS